METAIQNACQETSSGQSVTPKCNTDTRSG